MCETYHLHAVLATLIQNPEQDSVSNRKCCVLKKNHPSTMFFIWKNSINFHIYFQKLKSCHYFFFVFSPSNCCCIFSASSFFVYQFIYLSLRNLFQKCVLSLQIFWIRCKSKSLSSCDKCSKFPLIFNFLNTYSEDTFQKILIWHWKASKYKKRIRYQKTAFIKCISS